ncbi:unnamed protein product [Paramecium sonneborni]|uniref:Uncharacterized protein n=1 Tax=Paramecium sonneborni TaxID=65129 RepID=A0A8S1QDR5_9CILI|nr:unnamed protein product [Paramecium sonneborni]
MCLNVFQNFTKISIYIIQEKNLKQEQNVISILKYLFNRIDLKTIMIYKNNLETKFLAQITLPLKNQSFLLNTSKEEELMIEWNFQIAYQLNNNYYIKILYYTYDHISSFFYTNYQSFYKKYLNILGLEIEC